MSLLSTLSFTATPQKINDPKVFRRQRLIDRLEEQKKLAADASFAPIEKRWKKNPDGSKALIDHHRQIKPWWTIDESNKATLTVKSGLRIIEFEKGKSGIAVGDPKRLASVIDTVIAATKAGELDRFLETHTPIGLNGGTRAKKAA